MMLSLLGCGSATFAQDAQPAEQAPAAAPAPTQPGLIEGLNKLLKNSTDMLPSFPKNETPPSPPPAAPAPSAVPPAGPVAAPLAPPPEQAKGKATRLLPGMVTGRELCPVGANGAPDCQAGSDRLCQSKGYKSGKSLNTDTAFSCSARIARAGGKACGDEHFVTSAFCN